MDELESGIWSDAHPYDTRREKVRKGADGAKAHQGHAVPSGNARECGSEFVHERIRLLAQKLHREMELFGARPTKPRRRLAERLHRSEHLLANIGREVNREEEPHDLASKRR